MKRNGLAAIVQRKQVERALDEFAALWGVAQRHVKWDRWAREDEALVYAVRHGLKPAQLVTATGKTRSWLSVHMRTAIDAELYLHGVTPADDYRLIENERRNRTRNGRHSDLRYRIWERRWKALDRVERP